MPSDLLNMAAPYQVAPTQPQLGHSAAGPMPSETAEAAQHAAQLHLLTGVTSSSEPARLPGLPYSLSASRRIAPLDIQEALLDPGITAAGQQAAIQHPFSARKRRYIVGVFSLMAALLFADQNLLAPHLTQVADDFGFDDVQKDQYLGGYIQAAFFIVGAPAAVLVGWLADKYNRRNLLFGVVVIGATPCLATYWVTRYWQLLLLRTLTGISVGGCLPLVYSLLADLFPVERRSVVSAFIQIATGAGLAAGQALSAATGGSNWRIPFVIVAVPSIVVACIMLATTEEPPRGFFEEALRSAYADGDEYTETISWAAVKQLFRVPSNWLIFLQGLPGSLPWGMTLTFFNDYLHEDKGFSIGVATSIVLLFGVGGACGVIAGGALGQWLYNRRKEYMAILTGVSVFIGIPPMIYLVDAPLIDLPLGGTLTMALIGGVVASVAGPNLRAVLMNVNQPETRGVAFALQTTTDDLGKGLGPFIVAWFIKYLGRRNAFNVAIMGWVPCGMLLLGLVFCMRKDEAAMQARLQAKVAAAQAASVASEDDDNAQEGPGIPLVASQGGVAPKPVAMNETDGVNGVSSRHVSANGRTIWPHCNDIGGSYPLIDGNGGNQSHAGTSGGEMDHQRSSSPPLKMSSKGSMQLPAQMAVTARDGSSVDVQQQYSSTTGHSTAAVIAGVDVQRPLLFPLQHSDLVDSRYDGTSYSHHTLPGATEQQSSAVSSAAASSPPLPISTGAFVVPPLGPLGHNQAVRQSGSDAEQSGPGEAPLLQGAALAQAADANILFSSSAGRTHQSTSGLQGMQTLPFNAGVAIVTPGGNVTLPGG